MKLMNSLGYHLAFNKRPVLWFLLCCMVFLFVAVVVVSFSLSSFGFGTAKVAVQGLSLSHHSLDLGAGVPNSELEEMITVTNHGKMSVPFRIEKSCGCTGVSPDIGEIPAGEEISLTIRLKLKGELNAKSAANVTVCTDSERLTCAVNAVSIGPFEASPGRVDFGVISPRDVGRQHRTVALSASSTVVDQSLASLKFHQRGRDFQVRLLGQTSDHAQLEISLSPELKEGDYADTIMLSVDGDPQIVTLPVHVRVASHLSAVPAVLSLEMDPAGSSPLQAEFFVLSRDYNQPLNRVQASDLAHAGLVVEDIGKVKKHLHRLRVRVTNPKLAQSHGTVNCRLSPEGSAATCEMKIKIHQKHPIVGN